MNVNVVCGEVYIFIQIIDIGQDQWSIDAIVSLSLTLSHSIQIFIENCMESESFEI